MITLQQAPALFQQIVDCPPHELSDAIYEQRMQLLMERLRRCGLTHAVIYGDREHFSHMEYFTKYDCRFEEGLFILSEDGARYLVIGNEGMGFSAIVPYAVTRHLYQNFSLQGQPRGASKSLESILGACGITQSSKVGVVGVKYFNAGDIQSDPDQTYDVPEYILQALRATHAALSCFTRELTGYPDGIRMTLHDAEEIVWAEAAANRTASVVQRMLLYLQPGMAEYELPMLAQVGFDPHSMHPLCNFGDRSVMLGMASPGTRELRAGDPCGLCYGIRGNLTSRVSIAAYDMDSVREDLKPFIGSFYAKHFEALCAWYSHLRIGVTGDELYRCVDDVIPAKEFGVTLNPGHFIGTEEWTNAISAPGCQTRIVGNTLMQSDIIASGSQPIRTSICEDGVAIADSAMAKELHERYPVVYDRIQARRTAMEQIGIRLYPEVLPLSNLNGAFYPFMLNRNLVFAQKD